MRYNGLGDRLEESVDGVATQYSLDLGGGLTQVLADGASTYLYGAERLAQAGADLEYFGADALGSVRQLYDSAGQVVANRRYEPFGSLLSASGTGESIYGFAGEQLDASTGLVYLRARYLDTGVGRFTQVDPAAWEANPYLYAGANPANYTDPTGMWWWRDLWYDWAHQDIEQHYMGTTELGKRTKQLEYSIPITHARPDMFNSLLGGVYEIEPVNLAAAPGHGMLQALRYVVELSVFRAGLKGFTKGYTVYNPEPPEEYDWRETGFNLGSGIDWPGPFREHWPNLPPGYDLVADYVGPGLVLYWLEAPREVVVLEDALAAIGVGYAKLLREYGWSPRTELAPQPADIQYVKIACGAGIIIGVAGAVIVIALADDGTLIGTLDDALLVPLAAKLAELGLTLLRTPSGALQLGSLAP